ncbi:hypothetical protein I7860_28590 [Pseudomonas tolaasii]|uniref:hypothetical protein n=1 Tax=Pseudomonas tolaasii TaxID=29442 RepID=UPI001C57AC27|nr:hypothetical protein [Pseudomonas tolaasii]MBW1250632.1 hypothetical protein [Pseudomonas tolaasii]
MNHPDDPLASLAQSLTEDFNQHSGDQLQAAIQEREEWLAGVPAISEFAYPRKVRRTLLLLSLFAFVMAGGSVWDGNNALLGGVFAIVALVLLSGVWLHRRAGEEILMRLTHTHLWFRNLDAEINLLDISDIHIKEGRIKIWITLTLREGAPLPAFKNAAGPLMPNVKIKRSREPQICLTLFGLQLSGKILTAEQVLEMLDTYCNAARVEVELRTLKTS